MSLSLLLWQSAKRPMLGASLYTHRERERERAVANETNEAKPLLEHYGVNLHMSHATLLAANRPPTNRCRLSGRVGVKVRVNVSAPL